MYDNRMFLLDRGQFVILRSALDTEVAFDSLAEFAAYCPEFAGDFTGKYYIDYEPERGIYIDSTDPSVTTADTPVQEFEDVIDLVPTLIARKADPMYGMDAAGRVEYLRADLIQRIKTEAVAHMSVYLEAINSYAMAEFLGTIWPCLTDPTSVTELNLVKDVYLYAKTKIQDAKDATTEGELTSYDPESDPSWP